MDVQTMIRRAIFQTKLVGLHVSEAESLFDETVFLQPVDAIRLYIEAKGEASNALLALKVAESFLQEFVAEMDEYLLEADLQRSEQAK